MTRPQPQAHGWLQALKAQGWDAHALALLAIAPPTDIAGVQSAWQRIAGFDAVMFVSRSAVEYFFALRPPLSPVLWGEGGVDKKAMATGPGTRSALLNQGISPEHIDAPDASCGQFDTQALWSVMRHRVRQGYRVLIVRGQDAHQTSVEGSGREWFAQQLRAHGAEVEFVAAYQRACPELDAEQRRLALQASGPQGVWVWSSSQAIDHLGRLFPNQSWGQACAVATHARIAQAARQAGFGVVCESRPVVADVIASIKSLP